MKLFLASEVKHPLTIKKLEEYIHGFEGKSIAYIPTAANGEKWGSWQEGGSWNLVKTLPVKTTLLQLEDLTAEEIKTQMEGKDIIWFAGGMCGYLMYWIRRRGIDTYLKELLVHGSLYVGSSAGSMVTSKRLDIVEWYPGDLETGASIIPGLGLVDFDIYPHYEETMKDTIKKNYKGNRLYLLKNGEEIIVENEKIQLIGEERIITGSFS